MKAASKFFNKEINTYLWNDFFNKYPNKDDVILDFGCGAGWGILVGRERGFKIYGLDVKYEEEHPLYEFEIFREKMKIFKYIKLYNGIENLPFDDNTFSIIVCRNSLMRYTTCETNITASREQLVENRVKEFLRILDKDGSVVLTPYGQGNITAIKLQKLGITTLRWNNKKTLKNLKNYKE